MPTINQLVKKGRSKQKGKSGAPALLYTKTRSATKFCLTQGSPQNGVFVGVSAVP